MQWDLGDFKIRPFRRGDEKSLAKHANNPRVALNLRDTFPNPYTLEDAKRWVQMCTKEGFGETNWAIEVDGECAGGIGLVLKNDVYRYSAEIGYWLGEEHWGKGIMTRAAGVVADYGLNELGLIRVFTSIYERNPASMRVLEKNGFVKEGVERRSVVKNGVVLDAHVYARIKE